jgi:hypothetical protein
MVIHLLYVLLDHLQLLEPRVDMGWLVVGHKGYIDFLKQLPGAFRQDVYGFVREGGENYPLVALDSQMQGRPLLIITAGFHGDEHAGPITILKHGAYLAKYALERRVGLRIYPAINPSGLFNESRYNLSGEQGNNWFFNYELDGGDIKGELRLSDKFKRRVQRKNLPKESELLLKDLKRLPLPQAYLDLHQDGDCQQPSWYAYVFDVPPEFRKIAREVSMILPPYRGGRVKTMANGDERLVDTEGFTGTHDGSLADLYYSEGVHGNVTLETAIVTPEAQACEVNTTWAMGLIDMCATWNAGDISGR